MIRATAIFGAAFAAHAACADVANVSQFNGYSVTVRVSLGGIDKKQAATEKATEVCAAVEKAPEFQLFQMIGANRTEYFFLCL